VGNITATIRETTQQVLRPDVLSNLTSIVMAQELADRPDLANETTDFFTQRLQAQPEVNMEEILVGELQAIGLLREMPNNMLLPASNTASGESNRLSLASSLDSSVQVLDIYAE
jgi:hypothetical protein